MSTRESLPGRWVDLRLMPVGETVGLGPALGLLAGALASGAPVWAWPALGYLLLNVLLIGPTWGRLWSLAGEVAAPLPPAGAGTISRETPLALPYTVAGSLSAKLSSALTRFWFYLRRTFGVRGVSWLEAGILLAILVVVAGLGGGRSFLAVWVGVALLILRFLVRGRPLALGLLRVVAGLAWPWWLGHVAWASLGGPSLLVSTLWGVAYTGWADLASVRAGSGDLGRAAAGPARPNVPALVCVDLAQGAVMLFLLLFGAPVAAGVLALLLLGQVLLQAGLVRAGRWGEVARRTWPLAAAGMLLTGLVIGGWV